MRTETAAVTWEDQRVSAVWHHPARGRTYLVVGHGAGGSMYTPELVKFSEALAGRGIGAVRFNFPYAEARRRTPDRQVVLEACYRAVAGQVGQSADRLLLGGRSMGGRIASHLAAAGFAAAALVFLSYPLHPPGQPDRLRDKHLYGITIPMLFLQGTRDAFAQPELLQRTLARLPTATLHRVENADHGLRVPGKSSEEITVELVDTTVAWVNQLR
ncbi:MAG: hypothetical protein AUI83_23910 [Armatimonadetes bacterium 13_1_40CM_3_65_7]|uniref:Dienelactone hydrolase n=1 Tax=Candidatus Segetimicrobium genomatis TaxID=2569760 RepID=A0A537L6J7_9BACT|nr:MAG: hypothetical protein AUI83_23910 [Armatimonadetes bacterium 13_1_40CM_3_65_7]TMJ03642.1 MAG: dienelactone hydrolase [Terrabacteria group bacterium ANGP1]